MLHRYRQLPALYQHLILFGVGWICLSGCIPPSLSANWLQQRKVMRVSQHSIVTLTPSVLNNLIKWENSPHDRVSYGKIYVVTGQVRRISIGHDENDPKVITSVQAVLYLPEYIAVDIRCFFALEHLEKVMSLKKDQELSLRGSLYNYALELGREDITLMGCVVVTE